MSLQQFKRIKRTISGVLLLNKAYGISSNTALQQVRRLYQAEKAGHTGNLDPIATGLLPVCFGEATKFSQYLLDANKTYQAVIKLGATTTTGDVEGEITGESPVSISRDQVEQVLSGLVGTMQQIPPMYSALKHEGKALYSYARAGIEIERQPREITIFRLTLDELGTDELSVTVSCSKGTYIRVLAEQIGSLLGCGAHLKALHRVETGGFDIAKAWTFSQLEQMSNAQRDEVLLPADILLEGMPLVELDKDSAYYLLQGQPIWQSGQRFTGLVRVYGPGGVFLGLGENLGDGKLLPKRLIVLSKNLPAAGG